MAIEINTATHSRTRSNMSIRNRLYVLWVAVRALLFTKNGRCSIKVFDVKEEPREDGKGTCGTISVHETNWNMDMGMILAAEAGIIFTMIDENEEFGEWFFSKVLHKMMTKGMADILPVEKAKMEALLKNAGIASRDDNTTIN